MNTEVVLVEISNCIDEADLAGLEQNLELLLQNTTEAEASDQLASILINKYTTYKSGYLAKVLEVIIRKNPNLALLNHPDNPLFVAAVGTGSVDMYECYMEGAVLPLLAHVLIDEHEIHYIELQDKAHRISDQLFADLQKLLKGRNYNSAFNTSDNVNVLSIHREDYEAMELAIEAYNSIIGRRDIIEDLERITGLIE